MDDTSLCESIGKHIERIRGSLTETCDVLQKTQTELSAKDSEIPVEDQVDNILKTLLDVQTKLSETFDSTTASVKSSVTKWKCSKKPEVSQSEDNNTTDGEKPKIRLVALEKLQDPTLLTNNARQRLKPKPKQRLPVIPQKLNKSSIVISDSSDDEPIRAPVKEPPSTEAVKHAKSVKVQVESLPEDLASLKTKAKISEIRNNHGVLIEKLSEATKEPIKLVIKNTSNSRRCEPSDKKSSGMDKKSRKSSSDDFQSEEPSEQSKSKVMESDDSEDEVLAPKPAEKETKENKTKKKVSKDSDEDLAMPDDEDLSESEKVNGKLDEDNNSDNSTDSEIIVSRKKRKRAQSNSNSSASESDTKTKTTKKRRIKRPKNSDSSDDDKKDEKGEKSNKRKNIRKVIKDRDLEDDTKKAGREESERKKRIEERQKLYNTIYEEKDEVKELEKVVLDFDEESKEEILSVHADIVKKLKPHQGNGIKFMWDACFETLERTTSSDGSGCILAHCMGLGKTLQVIALAHTLLSNSEQTGVQRVLVICPLSTVLNWVNEFHKWLENVDDSDEIEVYELSKFKQNNERANVIKQWHTDGGVLVIGYDLFRNLSNEKNRAIKKKARESIQMGLINPGPELVVCDEGHLLKNEKTSISKAVNKIRTLRRIVLTGTPLQNNLKEYYCMVQFVKPNLLGKYTEYLNRFVNPITNGQYIDSTDRDIQVMKRRSHVLHKMLDGCVQRRDYGVLAPFLPPKHEYVVFIRLTELQIKLYKFYMENKSKCVDEGASKRTSILFADYQNLQRIWTHPRVLRYNSDRYEVNQQKKRDRMDEDEDSEGSLKDFIDDESSTPASSDSESGSTKSSVDKPLKRLTRTSRMATDEPLFQDTLEPMKVENPTEWWVDMVPEADLDNLKVSGKLMLLFSILEECEAIGDKLLVFSQSLFSLDVIEHFLSLVDENEQAKKTNPLLAGFAGSWSLGLDYFRLDGSTAIEHRNVAIRSFNQVDNHRARLFLISTKAGGLGVNLVAANRVVIFDASWNPSHDVQSIFRVYRFGQVKPCYIYRFLAMGTMEEKIYERQVTKQAISKRVIDEQQIDRHYREHDLMLLYKYDLEPEEPRETPRLPKDRLFADMLTKYDELVYKYHEHDSLLENKEEETLNEEERRAAWEEYESEKKRVPVINYGMMNANMALTGNYNVGAAGRAAMAGHVTTNNYFGFRGDIFLRLMDMKARQDHPEYDEIQIKSYIPVLVRQMYQEVSIGDMTTYNDLIVLQQELIESAGIMPNFYQGQNSQLTGGSSSNMMINPFSFNQNRQNYRQDNQLSGNVVVSDNGVINID